MCNTTHNKNFGLVLISDNEVLRCTVFILDYITIFLIPIVAQYHVFGVKFLVPPSCFMKIFHYNFFRDSFNVGVRQIIQKLILHQILYVYPSINFMNKGMSIVQKICLR